MPYICSEDDFLALVDTYFPRAHPSLLLGRGDDCAEVACPERLAVSTDLFLEDVHFRRAYFTPHEVGYKALAVNVSDLAAAGAVPVGFSAALVCPLPFPREDAKEFLAGMAAMAAPLHLALAGGDIARGDKLGVCITIWGAPVAEDAPFLRRHPVQPGYTLFYCGHMGLARTGLSMLELEGRAALTAYPAACAAHLTPIPLIRAGQAIAAAFPSCRLMDISDGLARDLPRMLGEHGADIAMPPETLHPEVLAFALHTGIEPGILACSGGEDFGLLGACPADSYAHLTTALSGIAPPVFLGAVTEKPGITLNGTAAPICGFDHFS